MANNDKPLLLVFAFNSVSVVMIGIEILRYANMLPQHVSDWFKSFCLDRERLPDAMILSHIYLLTGCAFPVTSTFTLVSGGIFPTEWTLYSLSGVVFLGVGDTCAAILGRRYGSDKWREFSGKTQLGSAWCVISMTATYYVLCHVVDDHHMYYFACYLFASIAGALAEGCTY